MNGNNKGKWILAILVLILAAVPSFFGLYGDFLWFSGLNYEEVFLKILAYKALLFCAAALLTAMILYAGYRWTVRNIRKEEGYEESFWAYGAIAFTSVFLGLAYTNSWETVLKFIDGVGFGVADPIFGLDVSFFAFVLPFLELVVGFLLLVFLLSLAASLFMYASRFASEDYEEIEPMTGRKVQGKNFSWKSFTAKLKELANTHLSIWIGVVLILTGVSTYLSRYDLILNQRGAVFGIGFVDQHVMLPFLLVTAGFAVLGGLAVIANSWINNSKIVFGVILAVIILSVLGSGTGTVVQNFVVEPDEFNKEKPFLAHEINLTNQAYALNRISEEQFPVSANLSREDIKNNPGTMNNVRLWDWRPLLKTYNELQIFRTYYNFQDVDVDRYDIGGDEMQVMLSPREIDVDALSPQSRSWVNRHLVYTHGFGLTMSPVKDVSDEGLPKLIVKDIPPISDVGINIDQPRIYYGENTNDYAIVNTKTQELDYPSGERNVYNSYSGEGGVKIDTFFKKVTFTAMFMSSQIFFSDSITPESRIQFRRNIQERAQRIAPFLRFDDDPYMVVADGELYWIYDAYTTTDKYPYSRRMNFKGDDVNYVRNSVKVVIDAHTGETDFYVSEPEDPVVETYRNIFPGLFKDFGEMPQELKEHVRYPEDIFKVQSMMYLDYHMRDPKVFYNKEDSWRVPSEILRGRQIRMEPYYIIMKLPGEEEAEFIQILPFIPRGKENMIGWLAARSDPPNYGKLQAFLFSKQELIFGPRQVESRIDQDTEISQRITLWSKSGSGVLRGNLLAIPIEDTILYVEPLFLQSRGEGSLPELKRVIVAQGDQLTMQPTLEGSLDVLFGEAEERKEVPVSVPGEEMEPERMKELRNLYSEARDALENGDFSTYAEKIDEMGSILED